MKKIAQKFSAATIAKRIAELGAKIRNDAPDGEVFLIGILKGSAVFLSDLIRAIDGNVGYAFIDVIRDVSDTQTAQAMEIDFLSHFDMGGRNLYILKDVVSTGVIESYLLTQLRQRNPSDIKLVALLDHTDLRKMDLKVDYTAFEVGSGTFVGYGLEAEGRYGNLPYIGKV